MAIWLINYLSIPIWNYFVKNKKIFVSIICFQMFLLMAFFEETLRVDFIGYYEGFNEISTYSFTEMIGKINVFGYPEIQKLKCESGWMILNWIIARIGFDFQGFLLLHGLFCVSSVGIFVYKYSDKPWLSLALFIALGFHKFSFGILRQMFAICLVMYTIPYIKERKPLQFLTIACLIFLIHRASLIYVALYYVSQVKINRKIFGGYYLIAFVGLVCSPFIVESVIVPLLELVNYGFYIPKQWALNNQVILVFILPVLLFATLDFDYFFDNKIYNIFCWGFLLTLPIQIFSTINDMFGRLAFGYYIFIIMLLPADLSHYKNEKIAVLGAWAVYGLCGLFYVYTMLGTSYVPYVSIWG